MRDRLYRWLRVDRGIRGNHHEITANRKVVAPNTRAHAMAGVDVPDYEQRVRFGDSVEKGIAFRAPFETRVSGAPVGHPVGVCP